MITAGKAVCCCGNMQPQVLPFAENPVLGAYNYSAFVSGIVDEGTYENFYANEYIQLCSPANYSKSHVLAFIPALGIENLAGAGLGHANPVPTNTENEARTAIVLGIRAGQYCRVVLDEYYIESRAAFGVRSQIHDNLILGFCEQCERCWLAGYRTSPGRRTPYFGISQCPLRNIVVGILSRPNGEGAAFLQDQVVRYSLLPPPPLRLSEVEHRLQRYLQSTHTVEEQLQQGYDRRSVEVMHGETCAFGIRVYDRLSRMLIESAGPHNHNLDMRAIRVFWEHKVLMTKRAEVIAKALAPGVPAGVAMQFRAIERAANKLRLGLVQWHLGKQPLSGRGAVATRNDETLKTASHSLTNLREDEERALEALLRAIERG